MHLCSLFSDVSFSWPVNLGRLAAQEFLWSESIGMFLLTSFQHNIHSCQGQGELPERERVGSGSPGGGENWLLGCGGEFL